MYNDLAGQYCLGMANRLSGTEMTFDEIAAQLGIKASTAQRHFENGMHKLRSRFPVLLRQMFDEAEQNRR